MTIFLSDYYDALEETLTHMKSTEINNYPGENVTYWWAEILLDAERLESAGVFNNENLGYITLIFEDTSDSRLTLWEIQKYKEVKEFINKICVCDMDIISPEELITYESLVQEDTLEYRNIVDSKQWGPSTGKEKYKYQHSITK